MKNSLKLVFTSAVAILLAGCGGNGTSGSGGSSGTPAVYDGVINVTLEFPSTCDISSVLTNNFSYQVQGTYTSGSYQTAILSQISTETLAQVRADGGTVTLISGVDNNKFPLNATYSVDISQDSTPIYFYCGGIRYYFEAATTVTPTTSDPVKSFTISSELASPVPLMYIKNSKVKSTWNHANWA